MNEETISILKQENINSGVMINCNKQMITEFKTGLFKKKINTKTYPFMDLIKQNNKFNYFKLREYTHDIKSYINSIYGLTSILEYDINEIVPSEENKPQCDSMKELIKELIESIESLTNFTTDTVNKYEATFSGEFKMSDLLIFYLPSYSDQIIIDSSLDKKYKLAYYILKQIITIIKEHEIKNVIIKQEKKVLNIKDFNGTVYDIQLK